MPNLVRMCNYRTPRVVTLPFATASTQTPRAYVAVLTVDVLMGMPCVCVCVCASSAL
jgi:hypothetical protein